MADLLDDTIKSLRKLTRINLDRIWLRVMNDREVKELILDLLTNDQLGNTGEGIDGDGDSLGEYAPFTINVRSALGLQTDHISFENTGRYLRSFKVRPTLTGWEITQDEDRYDELVEQTEITVEEQAELDGIIQSLAETIPLAVTGFDEYGKAMGIATDVGREFLEQQKRILARSVAPAVKEEEDAIASLGREIETATRGLKRNGKEWLTSFALRRSTTW